MVVLFIWLGINVAALIFMLYFLNHAEGPWDVLLYPKLHQWCREEDGDKVSIGVVDTMFTLLLLPAIIMYFAFLAIEVCFALIIYGIICLGKKYRGIK